MRGLIPSHIFLLFFEFTYIGENYENEENRENYENEENRENTYSK